MWRDDVGDEIHRNGEESNSSLSAGQLTSMASRRSLIGNHNGRGRGESGRIGSLIASTFSKIQDSLRDETAAVATSDKERQVDDKNTFLGQKWKEAEDYTRGGGVKGARLEACRCRMRPLLLLQRRTSGLLLPILLLIFIKVIKRCSTRMAVSSSCIRVTAMPSFGSLVDPSDDAGRRYST